MFCSVSTLYGGRKLVDHPKHRFAQAVDDERWKMRSLVRQRTPTRGLAPPSIGTLAATVQPHAHRPFPRD
jgi:hypothetical protein